MNDMPQENNGLAIKEAKVGVGVVVAGSMTSAERIRSMTYQ